MRIWFFSDLHLEYADLPGFEVPDADVCVAAGDILNKGILPSLNWLHTLINGKMPIIFVPGNHEFYKSSMVESLAAAQDAAALMDGIHFLNNKSVEIDGVMFIGATLWTDMNLQNNRQVATYFAQDKQVGMNDYKKISWQKLPWQRLTASKTITLHQESLTFIGDALTDHPEKKKVVVTHHAPSIRSMDEKQAKSNSAPAYASNLDAFIEEKKPDIWFHGHIHRSNRYVIGKTEIISNPRGYGDKEEGTSFNPKLIVEI